ncbi:MAG: carbohydrate kinase family protein [Anaerolineaceae bacterium]|nr:carbohydrate kinase family protein [Anaerolineaceae bacterium]
MTGQTPEIVFAGHLVQEMIHFPDRELGPVLGSPVAYGSLTASRLGGRAGLVSIVGTDMPPELLQPLRAAGVDLRGLQVLDGEHSTRSQLVYDESGHKQIHYPQQAPPLLPEHFPPGFRDAPVVAVVTMDHDLPLTTIRRLRHLPGALAVDLGGYGGAHSRARADAVAQQDPRELLELVGCFDIVRASVEDCALLSGAAAVADDAALRATLAAWLAQGPAVAMITLGERGCLLGTADGIRQIPAQAGPVVDTTGAGDAFFSAFLLHWLRHDDAGAAARFAAAAVMPVIGRSGGAHLERFPQLADVVLQPDS